ncbi:bolA-like protein 3 [Halyomorpha halys]|uniref:bolA-like protein 3 n=1 Tax=Halyomorpha halys TaxID=286706 RepID=UPI0006D502AE|nr:bolA-like protein 3 [Halyomorpha halys]
MRFHSRRLLCLSGGVRSLYAISPFQKMPHCLLRLVHSRNKLRVLQNSTALANFFSGRTLNSTENENKIKAILTANFPNAKAIEVTDVSGGCGAMYEILVEAPQFKGLTIVKQHRLITEALKEEIKDMHGLRIHTTPA